MSGGLIVYKDWITQHEMFSNSPPLLFDGDLVGIPVKKEVISQGISDALIGGNASAEGGGDEGAEDGAVTQLTCKTYNVDECPFEFAKKTHLKKYMQAFLKKFVAKLKQDAEESDIAKEKEELQNKLARLKGSLGDSLKAFVDKFDPDEDSIFSHESWDFSSEEEPLFIAKWNPDGVSLTLWTFKDCFIEEKC